MRFYLNLTNSMLSSLVYQLMASGLILHFQKIENCDFPGASYYILIDISARESCIHMTTSIGKSIKLPIKVGYYNFFTRFNIILILTHYFLFTNRRYLTLVVIIY